MSVATPTGLHAPITIAALDAAMHVLCEKPMAESADAAAAMVAAAERNERVLDVSFNHRRRGNVRALKALVDSGVFGRIYYAKTGWLRRQGIPGMGTWFTRKELAGGGPMMDLGVHMLDMALYLLGEPAGRTVSASAYAEFGPRGLGGWSFQNASAVTGGFDVEDLATAFVRLDDGATLLLESSWAQWIPHDRCYAELYGTERGARLEWGGPSAGGLEVWTAIDGVPATLAPQIGADGEHRACIADFVTTIRGVDHAAHRGHLALRRAAIVDAAPFRRTRCRGRPRRLTGGGVHPAGRRPRRGPSRLRAVNPGDVDDLRLEHVYLLFTDIERSTDLGSVRRTRCAGTAPRRPRDGRDRRRRRAVLKRTGDGAVGTFASARQAVDTAATLQRTLLSTPALGDVGVRMGVHCGSLERRLGDLHGPEMNRAARITAAAHGGQILVSRTVHDDYDNHDEHSCDDHGRDRRDGRQGHDSGDGNGRGEHHGAQRAGATQPLGSGRSARTAARPAAADRSYQVVAPGLRDDSSLRQP